MQSSRFEVWLVKHSLGFASTERSCRLEKSLLLSSPPQEDIFQQPGLRSEFAEIRDCLDTGAADSLCILSTPLLVCKC